VSPFGPTGTNTLAGGAGRDIFVGTDGDTVDTITDFDNSDSDGDGFADDWIDVAGILNAQGYPVRPRDITTTDDGNGKAVLAFLMGKQIILQCVDPASLTDRLALNAIGVTCFTPAILIRTANGDRPIDMLRPGDLIQTADNGLQPLRQIGERHLSLVDLSRNPELRPVLFCAGALGNAHDPLVSPQHCILPNAATGTRIAGTPGRHRVRAHHLAEADLPGIRFPHGRYLVTHLHMMLDTH
jgi:hypothetical protein